MHSRILALVFLFVLLFPQALHAQQKQGAQGAQGAQRFAVAPFGVHGPDEYAYLGPGVQSMLVSRLTWAGRLEPMDSAALKKALPKPVASSSQAGQTLQALGIDYMVWGSTTILGDNASLDVNVTGKDGKTLTKQGSMPLSELIPGLETVAREINATLFERPAEAAQAADQRASGGTATGVSAQSKANPLFQYEAEQDPSGVWRSRSFSFVAEFMDIGDLTGDGRNEVVLAEQGRVHVMRIEEGELRPVASLDLPRRSQIMAMNLYDIDGDGKEEIVFSAWRDDRPLSFVLGMQEDRLDTVRQDIRLHLNVLRAPPLYRKMLVCQAKGAQGPFDTAGVYQVSLEGPEPRIGAKILTPTKGNVFNMAYLPQGGNDYRIAVLDDSERLRAFSPTGNQLARSEETYNGTSNGLEVGDRTLPGMGKTREREREEWYYFVPMPMATVSTEGKEEHELLVNLNISVAARIFQRYRSFSQGEIHALRWDGVGLSTLWKTPRIKGTVMAYRMADADNDGSRDLCVLVAVSPGLSSARSLVLLYNMQ